MVHNVGISFKLLEKMAVKNQVSKFTAPNLRSFWTVFVDLNQFGNTNVTPGTMVVKVVGKTSNLVISTNLCCSKVV